MELAPLLTAQKIRLADLEVHKRALLEQRGKLDAEISLVERESEALMTQIRAELNLAALAQAAKKLADDEPPAPKE